MTDLEKQVRQEVAALAKQYRMMANHPQERWQLTVSSENIAIIADALAFRAAQPGEGKHRFGSPPEPVVNPSAEWLDAYADWYHQGKA